MRILANGGLKRLEGRYLFSEIAAKVEEFSKRHPSAEVISLGIGDVTLPLAGCVVEGMQLAVADMARQESFRGYPPAFGYDALRSALANYYKGRGVGVDAREIYISDGAKSDIADLGGILGANEVLIPTPVYPVYLDCTLIAGRRVRLLRGNAETGFLPSPHGLPKKPFVIYLCSPNNPTGSVFSRAELEEWVSFANESGSLVIFDAAYEAFVRDPSLPRSIFEIEGSRECAVEVGSFSKMAGFTGVRCGWSIIPSSLKASCGTPLGTLWERRQSTCRNGVSYITQMGAVAALSPEGLRENGEKITHYMDNAALLASALRDRGLRFFGGENAPYIWLECPRGMGSWEFFDRLLERAGIIGAPGVGFGKDGEGYFRFTAFGSRNDTLRAAERLKLVDVG